MAPLAAASRAATAGGFGPAERLRAPRRIRGTRATLGDNGAAAVAWVEGSGAGARVLATTRDDGVHPWNGARALSRRGVIDAAAPLALASDGGENLVALWSRRVGGRFRIERAEFHASREARR
jgi:hypothetical protein